MKVIYYLFCLLLLSSLVVGTSYYADIVIDVDNSGKVTISGTTDYDGLLVSKSSLFTSKDKNFWLLNISVPASFDPLVYEINLPKGSSITYMKLPDFSRVENTPSGIAIIGTAQNKALSIVVQYEIKTFTSFSVSLAFIGGSLAVFIVLFVLWYTRRKSKRKKPVSSYTRINKEFLSQRQRLLVDLIDMNGGNITQSKLEKESGLPKSSLSRNIATLVRKQILVKEQFGMTNTIAFKNKEGDDR